MSVAGEGFSSCIVQSSRFRLLQLRWRSLCHGPDHSGGVAVAINVSKCLQREFESGVFRRIRLSRYGVGPI